jgi:hypothetical protein
MACKMVYLTDRNKMSNKVADLGKDIADLEITPAMIEAGLEELYRFSRDRDEVKCLTEIYRAMVLAAHPT